MTERLQQLEDPHTEFVLQRSCYSLPKFSFILRTVDTTGMMPLLRRFDTVTRDGLARILGTTLDDRAWHQAKLPVSKGGMGMKAAVEVEVEGWERGEMVLSPSSLAHGMEGVEVTEGSDEVEGWGGGEVVAGGEGERGAFCLPKGQ